MSRRCATLPSQPTTELPRPCRSSRSRRPRRDRTGAVDRAATARRPTASTPRARPRRATSPDDPPWWRSAVIYQVYVAQLRRRQRRRDRRPGRRPRPAALPARPRRRRHLVHALVPLAARRRRLRRRRLPRHRPGVRHARGGRGADRRGPRRSASGRSSTSSPTTSPTSTPGSRRRSPPGPARPSASASGSAPGEGADGDELPTDWRLGLPGRRTWTRTTEPGRDAGRVVPPPVHAGAARPQLGPPGRARASTRTILRFWFDRGVGRRPHRLGGAAGQGPGAARGPGGPRARASTRTPTATSSTTSTAAGARSPTPTRARASSSARCGCRTSSGSRSYLRPGRAAHGVQLRLHGPAVGRGEPARVDRRDARRARARRRAGDLGAVQPRRHPAGHPLRPRATPRSRSTASGSGRRPTSTLGRRRARAAAC